MTHAGSECWKFWRGWHGHFGLSCSVRAYGTALVVVDREDENQIVVCPGSTRTCRWAR